MNVKREAVKIKEDKSTKRRQNRMAGTNLHHETAEHIFRNKIHVSTIQHPVK